MRHVPAVLTLSALALAGCGERPVSLDQAAEPRELLFSYFTGNGEDGLHLARSVDGLRWRALRSGASFLTPTQGRSRLMRDPSILYGPDSLFHMVWTIGWDERGIGYASSPDLVSWSPQRTIPVMEHEPDARNCWAPELFFDDRTATYLIVWSTTIPGRFPESDNQSNDGPPAPGRNHRLYVTTTADFVTFSPTTLFYDQGFNVIDGALARDGDRTVLFLKDETNKPFPPQKNIRIAFAPSPHGPFGPPSEPIHGPYWAEGPSPVYRNGRWYVYFDRYREGRFGLAVSDDLDIWSDWSDSLEVPDGMRHGTVFQAPSSVVRRLGAHEGE